MSTARVRSVSIVLIVLIVLSLLGGNPVNRFLKAVVDFPASLVFRVSKQDSNEVVITASTDAKSVELIKTKSLDAMECAVTSRSIGVYERVSTINCGSKKGVVEGNILLASGFVVGRIVRVYDATSRVQLISDPSFRLSAVIEGVEGESIVKGSVSSIVIDRVLSTENLAKRSITSFGEDSVVAGLPIGTIGDEVSGSGMVELKRYTVEAPVREEYVSQFYVIRTPKTP